MASSIDYRQVSQYRYQQPQQALDQEKAEFHETHALKEPDLDILLTRVRFDYLRSVPDSAVNLMLMARELAGPNWSEENESLLQKYREEASR